ncbi:MAG: rRNA (cytidine1920-2-O)/16S rRNA (cytidine1409-2-O)-methyltransferase [Thermoanaerobaculia bacterium]|jgi:23S rRNA (cytidine1920-2'-O)/16S rRNA (cytidine1409-2'-O)-methyltransferase|nr:rRNA (cytidine1920-2-O)/16S rRNA (cytidine1409-2-O)-methyltransferase [Thermoanaerobaculia bacterium]
MKKQRLDVALVERGLCETRSKAQSLIMARRILVNGEYVDKAGANVADDDELRIEALEHPWVGRGGMKLAHALREFGISVDGKICADIGASTGGFTDVMLKSGAKKVYAIDVGYGQIDVSLRNDPRVVNREKVNARYLTAADFEDVIEFVSIDVSFIPLKLILPAVATFLRGELVALIKPQFEVGKADVGKGGIVRDEIKRAAAVDAVVAFARETGFEVRGVIESPVKGAEGNVEYLMCAGNLADRAI